MKKLLIISAVLVILTIPSYVFAQQITILHTNDMHSRLTGDGPEVDYSPMVVNNDEVLGGFARLATLIKQQKAADPAGTLVLDAGDFYMGTLFNTVEPKTGFQLHLMKEMGFDFTTIGNHEFDYGPQALAGAINAAKKFGDIPEIISSNLIFDKTDPRDDALESLFKDGTIIPYKIVEVKGVRIGIFGLLGIDAADVAPLKAPVTAAKQIKTARKTAKMLKKEKGADLVFCLSHSGVYPDGKGGFEGEDVKLAKKVKDIDVIFSGHTHVVVNKPFKVKNTLIVQTGSYLKNLGELTLNIKNGKIADYRYQLIPVDDKIKGDPVVNLKIEAYKDAINREILDNLGLAYSDTVAETSFDLMKHNEKGYQHTNLGVFCVDAIKYYVDNYGGGTDVELLASGTVRDNILKGKTGFVTVPDVFRVMSLGRANEKLPGYPLQKIYITGHELKNLMEVLLLSGGDDGYVFVSGIKVYYNPKKMMLRKVVKIEMNGKPVDLSKKNPKLYSVTADSYLLSFIGRVKSLSKGLVNVVPKKADGTPVTDMSSMTIDFDNNTNGVQPGTEWIGIIKYMQHLKDTNGNGVPDLPVDYKNERSNRIPVE